MGEIRRCDTHPTGHLQGEIRFRLIAADGGVKLCGLTDQTESAGIAEHIKFFSHRFILDFWFN
jgi:hypothetical protein